jgi:hypothetical protein
MLARIERYVAFLEAHGFSKNQLYKRSLLDHLISTYSLSKNLRCNDNICTVGLFHSIYGEINEYALKGFEISQRREIANLIGYENEQLVYLFWLGEYNGSLKGNIKKTSDYFIVDGTNNKIIPVSLNTVKNLLIVSAINLIEQVIYALNNSLATKMELLTYIEPYTKAEFLLPANIYKKVTDYFQICSNEQ